MASDRDDPALIGGRRRAVASLSLFLFGALAPWRAAAKNAQVDEDFGDKPRPGGKDKSGNAIKQELDRYAGAKPVNVAEIAAGGAHTVVVRRDGALLAWGDNDLAQLGTGDGQYRNAPATVGNGYAFVAAGRSHSLAIRKDGSLYAFGDNRAGQLGDGSTSRRATPVRVGSDSDWTAVAAGDAFSLGLRGNRLYAWGANDDGQLGLGSAAASSTPQPVPGDFVRIAAGAHHSVALRQDGSVWAWGATEQGQAGAQRSAVPRQV